MMVAFNLIAALWLCMFYRYSAAPPDYLPNMVIGKGPNRCLWAFAKGIPGKASVHFSQSPPPGNFIEGALLQFTAQV